MAFAIKAHQGRLIIAKITPPIEPAEGALYIQALGKILASIGGKAVILTDVGELQKVSKQAADTYGAVLKANNAHLIRSAIYLGELPAAGAGLVLYNLVKDNENQSRRLFARIPEMRVWLEEVLTPEETHTLNTYLKRIA